MKLFPQLALVSAIAVSGSAFAMEALNDATLSNTTGQDGITIAIKPPTKDFDSRTTVPTTYFTSAGNPTGKAGVIDIASVRVHDKDGDSVNGAGTAGAIVLDGFSLAGSKAIEVAIDSDGGTGGTAPLLNVKVTLPDVLVIRTGDISVAASNGIGAALGTKVKVLDTMDIKLGKSTMNIQLGNEAQGAMIKMGGTVAGGLEINKFKLNDANSGGSIGIDKITLIDGSGTNVGTALTLSSSIDVVANGLQVKSTGTTLLDVRLKDVRLGDFGTAAAPLIPASIGDVELVGIDTLGTTLTISGH